MDRERLHRWLHAPRHTWRWRRDESQAGYEAVEVTEAGLRWFRWSHELHDGGEQDAEVQSFEHFRLQGPLRQPPASIAAELRSWIDTHMRHRS